MDAISMETALAYLDAGLSCLPATKEKKHPTCGSWKKYAVECPKRIEVESWFANKHDAICIVTGKVSGNLECMDFDNHGEQFEAWKAKVEPDVFQRLVVERSPSGGYHVLYRSDSPVSGNLKLSRGYREKNLVTLIETRGEGGLFLCAPTSGYELIQGDFTHLGLVTALERKALLNAARSLDEVEAATTQPAPAGATQGVSGGFVGERTQFLERPGDDFSNRGDVRPYLTAAGWTLIGHHPSGNELWRRPGKSSGSHSATFDGKVFYVFSSNAAPFESEKGYSAFQVYALLEHRGDFTAAASALLSKGYGKPDSALNGVDLSKFGANISMSGQVNTQTPASEEDKPLDLPLGELVEKYPNMRKELIDGVLREGETMNIIAPPKTGKSWLVTDLALAVATGTDWFGYPCNQGRVLNLDNELHPETSANRIPKVVRARGYSVQRISPWLSIYNQRGRLKTIEDIGKNAEYYKKQGYKMIIIDAFYRAMPNGVDENDNGAVAGVYNLLDRYAAQIGCAFVLIHHTSKGNQAQKSVTDVGSGAGSQSRAADTHLILRHHKEKGCVVMDSVVRSFKSLEPVCLRWNYPLWEIDPSLSAEELEGAAEPKFRKTGADQGSDEQHLIDHIAEMVDPNNPMDKGDFTRALQMNHHLSRNAARRLLLEAVEKGYLKFGQVEGSSVRTNASKLVLRGDNAPVDEVEEEDENTLDEDD